MRARKFVYFNAWRKESFGDQQTDIKFISGGSIEVGRYISRIYRAQFLSVQNDAIRNLVDYVNEQWILHQRKLNSTENGDMPWVEVG